jgi:phosphomannomutase
VNTLRLSSFGLRGYVGESLTPDAVLDFVSAFAAFVEGGRLLLGCDPRASSPMLRAATLASWMSAGGEVVDFGLCPTPILQFHTPRRAAAGAISISGAHHPQGWNTLTLIGADGGPLDPVVGEQVLDIFHAGAFPMSDARGIGEVHDADEFTNDYFDALARYADAAAIRAARFRVIADPAGGAGGPFLEPWARRFGVELIAVNGEPTPLPARDPEPRPRTARSIASLMRPLAAAAGFVFSSDMGRLSLVTERGEPLSEELTFALIADHVLRRRPGPLVTNCCTTRAIDDLAARHGVPLIKTPVGQAHIVAALRDDDSAVLGGEGSGSIVRPDFSLGFDGFLMMTLVLESLAGGGATLSERVRLLPRYEIVKRSVACPPGEGYRAIERVRARLGRERPERLDETDGLRLDDEDGWVHLRASRTEPRVRVISESRDRATAEERAERWIRWVELED